MAQTVQSQNGSLAREVIGLPEAVFQSVTFMAPAAGVALALIPGANFAGGALPLSVLLALIACLLVANSIAQLAKHLPSAGGVYTFAAHGLHPTVGILVVWFYAFAMFLGFSMGRIKVMPAILGKTHPGHRSPYIAIIAAYVLGTAVTIWLGEKYGPLIAFFFIGTVYTAIVIAIYLVANLACIVYYLRDRRSEFNWFLHGLVPILGIAAFIPAFLTAIGVGSNVFKFISPLPYPFSLTGPILGIFSLLVVADLVYLLIRHPERIRQTETIFLAEAVGEPVILEAEPIPGASLTRAETERTRI